MMLAISRISGSSMPRVDGPGVPTRMPDGVDGGFGSNGIWFLLRAMPTSSHTASAALPSMPSGRRSASSRCESVPPETMRSPSSVSPAASARASRTVRSA